VAGFFGRDTTLREEGVIARVAGQPIRQADVERQLNNYGIEGDQRKQIASSYIIPQQIQGAVMDEAARRAGITVSDEELRAKLRDEVVRGHENPGDGKPDRSLREAAQADGLHHRRVRGGAALRPAPGEIHPAAGGRADRAAGGGEVGVHEGEGHRHRRLLHGGERPAGQGHPDPKPAEIEAAYHRDIAQYQFGERRALKVLAARPATFQQAFKAGDAELKRYFDTVKKDYRRASHILVRLSPQADPGAEAKVKEQAEKYASRARAGEDFAAIAAVGSEDGSKGKGGDLGWFSKGAMVAEFDKAVFDGGNTVGKIIGPVKTQFGYHVIKITGIGTDLKEIPPEMKEVPQGYRRAANPCSNRNTSPARPTVSRSRRTPSGRSCSPSRTKPT
jgi:peptidyl-prolyl cis-trans isomerase D